tara:strand:+ start:4177 stop:5178 length:1002 start_codon:yes stop_codon:yes gene_type:complete
MDVKTLLERFRTDFDWDIVKELKDIGQSFIRDNTYEKGPLTILPGNRYKNKDFAYDYTPPMHTNAAASLNDQEFPCHSKEYATDIERNWKKNMRSKKKKWLKQSGWINPDGTMKENDYYFCKQGFRHDGSTPDYLEDTGGVIYIGDSNVLGMGIMLEDSFTYKAHYSCSKTKDKRYLNMGMHGHGIDAYYRILKYYIEEIQPDIIVMSHPWQGARTEYFSDAIGHWYSITANKLIREQLKMDKEDALVQYFHTVMGYTRWYKNLDAIKWLCHSNNVDLLAVEEDVDDSYRDSIVARFDNKFRVEDMSRELSHQGPKAHARNANVLRDLMEYVL